MTGTPLRGGRGAVRLAAIAAGALALAWFAVSVSIAAASRTGAPELALRFASHDAVAAGNQAYGLIEQGADAAGIRRARSLAVMALRRDPTVIPAYRTLGLLADADGRRGTARRIFSATETLSRRDFPVELWLIDDRVQADDVAGALVHFDRALRTSRLAEPVLIPILVRATEDSRLLGPIGRLLIASPEWRKPYFLALYNGGKASENIARLLESVGNLEERKLFAARLASEKRFAAAAALFARAGGDLHSSVRGPYFDAQPGDFLPFDWEFVNSDGVSAEARATGSDGKKALDFSVRGGRRSDIARQLLALKPGNYAIATEASGAWPRDAAPTWTMTCASEAGPVLSTLALTAGTGFAPGKASFTVPAGCAYQWLRLQNAPYDDSQDVDGTVGFVTIVPQGGSG